MSARPGELKATWSKRERDVLFSRGEGVPKCDGHLLYGAISTTFAMKRSLLDELEARGYDITTLRFSIRQRAREESMSAPEVEHG